ncbi:MAG TPA: hypothetical protein VLA83_20830, partial [Candidatus Binatia bacterium]|nr:hypothetical protein [Candidatus Binatia bacterium]
MSGLNLLVFREGRRRASGKELKAGLTAQFQQWCSRSSQRACLDALLRAGEFECGIADRYPESASSVESLTSQIADAFLAGESASSVRPDLQKPDFQSLLNAARALPEFEQLSISTPEGFAHYALHPLAYADVIQQIPVCDRLLIVGIRSIGTTLSAIAAAAACSGGIAAE